VIPPDLARQYVPAVIQIARVDALDLGQSNGLTEESVALHANADDAETYALQRTAWLDARDCVANEGWRDDRCARRARDGCADSYKFSARERFRHKGTRMEERGHNKRRLHAAAHAVEIEDIT
jgi:hypothetical protein